jgi:excisionase family DNA binding protein
MHATKRKSSAKQKSSRVRRSRADGGASDVLTLAEAAAYLRIPEQSVLRAVRPGGLPARLIDGEWRFLKSALQDWLSAPPRRGNKEASLKIAGAFKNDPFLEEIVRAAYEKRGRPITENGE